MQSVAPKYDVIVIGAGSAGLFAAAELAGHDLKMLVVDRGEEPSKRTEMNFGIGGAGTFSDGKLNLTARIGGDPSSFGRSAAEVEQVIERVDQLFTRIGVEGGYSGRNGEALTRIMKSACAVGVEFIFARQRHIGTDRLKQVTEHFYQYLCQSGVTFRKNTRIQTIHAADRGYLLSTGQEHFWAKAVIACPGRAGAYWLREQARGLAIKLAYGPIDVGVRVEFPAVIYDDIAQVMYDAKFRLYSKVYDDLVRTFCTNPNGYIVREQYDEFVLVNGHAHRDSKTANTNFALLSRVRLTDPVEDSTKYGRDIARLATTIGGGKPLIQRLSDFISGRRSTWDRLARSSITPTLSDVTPGDIAMAFPQRIVANLMDGLNVLNQIIVGLVSNNTLIYAPEIKFYDTTYHVTSFMETTAPDFFVAGDASGHSRGIIYSAVTGIFAAQGVLTNLAR